MTYDELLEEFKDPLLAAYYDLRPSTYSFVEKLEFIQDDDVYEGYDAFLNIVLSPLDRKDHRRLYLSFSGVSDFRMPARRIPSSTLYLTTLEIQSIKDRQWGEYAYSVKETEHDAIEFICCDFTVVVR